MAQVITKRIAYIWGGKASDHKQGKIPEGVHLNEIFSAQGRYELNPEHTKAVIEHYDPNRDSNYKVYPSFWIEMSDVNQAPGPNPNPVELPVDADGCLSALLKLLKQ